MLRFLLFIQAAVLIFYTVIVVTNEGWDFITVAIKNTTAFSWSGQFGLDFTCYLMLSGLWVAWREKFTISSIILGLIVMFLGILIFAPTVLSISNRRRRTKNAAWKENRSQINKKKLLPNKGEQLFLC
jgi:hypothetical protein